jgi:hypothetical protein
MSKLSVFICFFSVALNLPAQTGIISTNTLAEQIMLGNYNPGVFMPAEKINHPDTISLGINTGISADSLKSYLEVLSSFYNRNTGSDTISSLTGIGAARRWVSAQNENRLVPSYLQFNQNICNTPQHRNIFAVLPAVDTSQKNIIILEGHIDSRCKDLCDTTCLAEGIEDNASGTALVIELARVMSKYSFNHSIVFMATIGEEQGLYGANAFAVYCQQKGIKIKAVFNNDVIGGIICGNTSSPPSCSPAGSIDSLSVRIFSAGTFNSAHKQLARFTKLEYNEQILPVASVPMMINIMTPEDRTGRGGDHIPFRQKGFTAIRFTSANEHGDANVSNASYSDRQHTSDDILGIDLNGDMILDSFFVDFNYLARNSVINGNAVAMAAIGPLTPDFTVQSAGENKILVNITQQTQYTHYRLAVRTLDNDWDTLYDFNSVFSDTIEINNTSGNHFFSVCSVDSNGIESLFSKEILMNINSVSDNNFIADENVVLLGNRPNPFDIATTISVYVGKPITSSDSYIVITDVRGRVVKRLPITLSPGMNETLYEHGYGYSGIYYYSLFIDNKLIQTNTMVFAN